MISKFELSLLYSFACVNMSKIASINLTLHDLKSTVGGIAVLIVEDIVDTGLTLSYLQDLLRARRPASLRTCVLLDKSARRETAVKVDYCGFEIPDAFVVGYGLDYAEKYRNLPCIGVLKREIYA